MNIVMVKTEDLKPADYNPRMATEKDVEDLKKSIQQFGLVDPIIVNENPNRKNIVIGGHFRLMIAKQLKIPEVPVVYLNLEEVQERELNLRLNRNLGKWDYDLLANNFDSELLLSVGFTEGELGMGDNKDLIDKDESMLDKDLDTYLDGSIKQIVLFFKKDEFDNIIERLTKVMAETQTDSHTSAFVKLLEHYENTRVKKEAA